MPGCKRASALYYLRRSLCDYHWNKLSELPVDEMKELLGIRRKKKVIVAQPAEEPEPIDTGTI